MKTILEYYEELKPEHRQLAIDNYDLDYYNESTTPGLLGAILRGFDWGKTPQAEDRLWSTIYDQLVNGTYFTEGAPEDQSGNGNGLQAAVEEGEKLPWNAPGDAEPVAEDVLEEALRITGGDRMADYGPPDQDFRRTAIMWEQILNTRIKDGQLSILPQDVASCMIALKLSRQTHQSKRDNWTDIAGYARCGNLCQEQETKGE